MKSLKTFLGSIKYTLLFAACALNIMQSSFAFAASTEGMCDPDNSIRRGRQLFRMTNDILYYDDCANSCSAAAGTQLPGDNNAERAYNYLVTHGYTPEQAAGIVGNMILESGVNPQRLQGTGLDTLTPADQAASSSEGWGIVQWTPAGKMIRPVKESGKDPNDLNTQLDYLTSGNQLNGGATGDAADKIRATSSVDDATQAFGQYYEGPRDLGSSIELRKTYAQAIYEKATKGTPYPPEVAASIYKGDGTGTVASQASVSQCGSTRTDNGECQNPFRDLKNSYPMRWDGGLDYGGDGGSGPIYAACPAEIEEVTTSWPGDPGAYIRYKFTAGKAEGLQMYIAEDCTPTVKTGDKVTTDEPICQYQQHSTYLETGWAKEDCYCGTNSSYVSWSDYPGKANAFASNSGVDVGQFLESLGVGKGHDSGAGISSTPPPANWPKWSSTSTGTASGVNL